MKVAVQWLGLFVVTILAFVVGLPAVAVAVFFLVDDFSASDGRRIINAPRWLWLWGNDFDGYDGDGRGWWAANSIFGWPVQNKFVRWWWAAIRNPANNRRRIKLFSCPVAMCRISYSGQRVVEDRPGLGGWQFVTASYNSKSWYGFYWVKELSKTRAFVVRMGFKIKPDHLGRDEPDKGYTFKINPYKAI